MSEAALPPLERAYETLKGKRILYMMADEFACGHYRCRIPARYLSAAEIYAVPMFGLWHEEAWWPKGFGQEFDIIIAQRQISEVAYRKVKEWKDAGKIIITEVDDHLHGVLPTSPAYAVYKPGSEVLRVTGKFLEMADAVTVTTSELADVYRAYNRNIYVVPNAIDFEIRNWGPPPGGVVKPEGKVVFGWAESAQP